MSDQKRTRRYWLNILWFGLLSFLVLGPTAYFTLVVIKITQPAHVPLGKITPMNAGLAYENVTLNGHDGVRLAGWYIPSKNGAAVILLHGYNSNRLGVMLQAEMLGRHGYGVLLYDQRACGESEGDQLTWGWEDVYDVPAAVDYLKSRVEVDPQRIGIFGSSTGGEVAIGAAALSQDLRAVVSDGAGFAVASDMPRMANFKDWFMSLPTGLILKLVEWKTSVQPPIPLRQAVKQIAPRPLLLISTRQDFEMRQNELYYQLAGDPKTHWNIPDTTHTGGPLARPKEYEQRLVGFFDEALAK